MITDDIFRRSAGTAKQQATNILNLAALELGDESIKEPLDETKLSRARLMFVRAKARYEAVLHFIEIVENTARNAADAAAQNAVGKGGAS